MVSPKRPLSRCMEWVRALIKDSKADLPPSHNSVTGRVIGGVVGGVVGLCIIAALFWWFLARHRRPGYETPTPQVQVSRQRGSEGFDQKAELDGNYVPRNGLLERSELEITRTKPVLAGVHDVSLAGLQFHALHAQLASQDTTRDSRHELV